MLWWSCPDLMETFKTRDDEAAKLIEMGSLLTLYKLVHEIGARPVSTQYEYEESQTTFMNFEREER